MEKGPGLLSAWTDFIRLDAKPHLRAHTPVESWRLPSAAGTLVRLAIPGLSRETEKKEKSKRKKERKRGDVGKRQGDGQNANARFLSLALICRRPGNDSEKHSRCTFFRPTRCLLFRPLACFLHLRINVFFASAWQSLGRLGAHTG